MPDDERLGVYFLDVGQGDCTFVLDGGGRGVLFDCADALVAKQFATDKGLGELRAVVVSHLDADHIRGMHAFLKWWIEDQKAPLGVLHIDVDRATLTKVARELLAAVLTWDGDRKLTLDRSDRGLRPTPVWSSGDARVELVLPWYAKKLEGRVEGREKPNESSAVLRVVRGGAAILIGGDAPVSSWQQLEPELLPARVFRVPHHGGTIDEGAAGWTLETLYERVDAEHAVVSVGTNNGNYAHPQAEHVRAMKRGERCRVLCTQLTPQCHSNPSALRPGYEARSSGVSPPYRQRSKEGEVPCAGSVAAWIDDRGAVEVEPARALHESFIGTLSRPLCKA